MDLNKDWVITVAGTDLTGDLPYDVTARAVRDYSCEFGELNGFHTAAKATFTKKLPKVTDQEATLVISGACGYGDVLLNGETVGKIKSYAPVEIDLTDKLKAANNTLQIELVSVPGMSDKYKGLGIAGGVELHLTENLDISYGSLFVTTATVGDKTYADVHFTVKNIGEAKKLTLECTVLNARGKRAGKKQRKIYARTNTVKQYTVRVRIAKPYEWTPNDPYMYSVHAAVLYGEDDISADTRFGLVRRSLTGRGLHINGKIEQLYGAYVSHADALIGGISNYSNEVRRLSALKALGYNAVRFTECPCDATLDALDDIGMYAYVDLFEVLGTAKAPLDAHIFAGEPEGYIPSAVASVKKLRAHPSVTLYGVADDVPECYNRNNGHKVITTIASAIRGLDESRPVTVSAHEELPTLRELEEAGIRRNLGSESAMINAAREKDLFGTLTSGAFDCVDVCGFNYLYPLYDAETKRGRFVVGSRTRADKAFESLDETEKNSRVIGDFAECGIDYPGGGKLNEQVCTRGDLDAICELKPQGVYKSIMLGNRNAAYIVVLDPDTNEPTHVWNWPRYLGQTVTVQVYTAGDVVALYLDGRLIGRKLAGKINKHVATFKTEYYPGMLVAVSYYKGVECAQTVLKSAASPKTVKLSVPTKNLYLSRGDLGFVRIEVCDKDGNPVPYAMRTLNATVTGGELVGFINADPMLRKSEDDSCPAFDGKAMCAVKPNPSEDRMTVKITGEGLLASKITFKIKD